MNNKHNISDVFKNIVNDNTVVEVKTTINGKEALIIYNKTLIDIIVFNEFFLKRMAIHEIEKFPEIFAGLIENEIDISIDNISKNLSNGNLYIYFNDLDILYRMLIPKLPQRSITESTIDPTNLYGAKDSLIENIKQNIALIERRLKTNKLKFVTNYIGQITKTEIDLLYIEGLVKQSYIKKIEKILSSINIEALKTVDDIAMYFNKKSLVPLVSYTASTEIISNSLLNGRFAILIDNIPVCIILPVSFDYFTNLPDEVSGPMYYTIYRRIITFILIFISVFFLGIYVAFINYHSNSISMLLVSELKVSIKGSTLPLIGEILFIILTFELLKMASLRIPSSYIQNVIIMVGGLLIGQNTVSSGFVSPFNLVVTSFCYITTFGVTNNKFLIISLSIMRLFILTLSVIAGLYGFIIASCICLLYLFKQKSMGITFLSPVTFKSFKNIFIPKEKVKSKVTV